MLHEKVGKHDTLNRGRSDGSKLIEQALHFSKSTIALCDPRSSLQLEIKVLVGKL